MNKMLLAIDLRSAFERPRKDNFNALLIRLLCKADSVNRGKLAQVYPEIAEGVRIFKNECPYKDEAKNEPDYDKIAGMVVEREHRSFPDFSAFRAIMK